MVSANGDGTHELVASRRSRAWGLGPGAFRLVLVAFVIALPSAAASCGGEPPRAPPRQENVARWSDVFEGTPDIFAVVRPQALKRDALYGSFWRALIRAAQARGFARGARMVEAAEGAEEIIVGVDEGSDAVLVLRSVPASLDPERVVDAEGRPLFRARDERAKVVEYELLDPSVPDGALFVLPGRTWVGALGDARERARQVFATPSNRPAPTVDPEGLVVVRFAGPIVHVLDRHPRWGALTRKLSSATFTLKPGNGGLVVALRYEEASATAMAEMQAKQIVEEIARDDERFAWLKEAKVKYEGDTVFVRVAVPPRLLEELPQATGADLGL